MANSPQAFDRRYLALCAAMAPIEEVIGSPIVLKQVRGARMRLRVREVSIELSVPHDVSAVDAGQFAESQIAWMRRSLSASTAKISAADADFRVQLQESDSVFLFGAKHALSYDPDAILIKADGEKLRIGLDPSRSTAAQVRRLVSNYATEQLSRIAMQEIKRVSELFGTRMHTLRISAMRSRWGSLAHDNRMSLNFALVFANTECIQYVVCHELAHTLERNHSKRFWAHVARAQPGYKAHHQTLQKQYETYMRLTQRLLDKS